MSLVYGLSYINNRITLREAHQHGYDTDYTSLCTLSVAEALPLYSSNFVSYTDPLIRDLFFGKSKPSVLFNKSHLYLTYQDSNRYTTKKLTIDSNNYSNLLKWAVDEKKKFYVFDKSKIIKLLIDYLNNNDRSFTVCLYEDRVEIEDTSTLGYMTGAIHALFDLGNTGSIHFELYKKLYKKSDKELEKISFNVSISNTEVPHLITEEVHHYKETKTLAYSASSIFQYPLTTPRTE